MRIDMRRTWIAATALLGLAASAGTAGAGTILNPRNDQEIQINFYEPIGNSFIAEDATVSAALWLVVMNETFEPSDPILFQLYAGAGTSGAPLFSQSFVVDGAFRGFYDVDLSSVVLSVGETYSFVASIVGDSPYWGVAASDGPNGELLAGRFGVFEEFLALRVGAAGTAVPEPSSLALALVGLAAPAAFALRRRSA
ncbi:PEP-CTERM sorting domain-containing protein [Paludisphaera soli]|uniref:PEP-CTERM sorting domain-containing protein n=1 Tax=Paludisphaera soli TaxID=2712865 RepID=UPI0013EBFD9D|nr:PEP-CTERM sorting domain-containing protein [Paludisphaera soli]